MSTEKTKLRSVNRASPCPVCGKSHKCALGTDGLILCGRLSGEQPGYVFLGQSKGDNQWALFRAADDPILLARERLRIPAPKIPPRPSVDWPALAMQLARNLTPALADELCERLGLPRAALDTLPLIGHDAADGCWTFPEEDGAGRIVGIARRFRDGRKRTIPGSRRGLTVPCHWNERGTPLFIVEGASDVLALSLCAVSTVGRPSNVGGIDMLTQLLVRFPTDRSLIVMAESDAKPSGLWPGRDGAIRVAEALSERLNRRVAWALPPDGAKDVRAWVLSQKPISNILDSFHLIGEQLWEN